MTEDIHQLWGITGIILPWAVKDADGSVAYHGAMRIGFTQGVTLERLPEMAPTIARLGNDLKDIVSNGPLKEGQTFERITISEYQRLESENADENENEETESEAANG